MTLKKTTKEIYEILENARETDRVYDACRNVIDYIDNGWAVGILDAHIAGAEQHVKQKEEQLARLNSKRIKTSRTQYKIDLLTNYYRHDKTELEFVTGIKAAFKNSGFSTIEEAKFYAIDLEMKTVKNYIDANLDNQDVKDILADKLSRNGRGCKAFDREEFAQSQTVFRGDNGAALRMESMLDSYTAQLTRNMLNQKDLDAIKNNIATADAEDELEK